MTALNPVMTIGDQIDEIFRFHVSMPPEERQKRALGLLEDVNLPDPERIMSAIHMNCLVVSDNDQ